ncbi:MAG: hypothetical protein ACNS60_12085 [Candidatus Cyclobacteriaceae bacterium M2_1C_046]
MKPFGLTKPHFIIIARTLGLSIIIIFILYLLDGIFLQAPGIFWFAIIASLSAQLSTKLRKEMINFEIAFGIGIFTLLLAHVILLPLGVILGNNEIHFDSIFAYLSLVFIIGVILQLIISLIFIKFSNP